MINTLYTIPNSSMYVKILKVRYRGDGYRKVRLAYFTKPGKQLMRIENDVKLDDKVFSFWITEEN